MPGSAGRTRWIGVAAVGVAAGAIAVVLALRSGSEAPPHASAGSSTQDLPRPGAAGPDAGSVATSPASTAQQAARLVASARAEIAAGNLAQARELLTQAYALDPSPATVLELGRVDYQTGHCRDARRAAQRVIEAAPAGSLADDARDLLAKIGRCD
jgi:hypothetical protein